MSPIDSATIDALKKGALILYPTDTIWGIGCDATNEEAVRKVFALKQRADSKALVLLVSDLDMLARYVREVPEMAVQLIEVNVSPMTIIYPSAEPTLASSCIAEDGSVAIRIPQHDWCRALIRRLGRPLVSTSANISGEASPKCFEDISDAIRSGVDIIAPREVDTSKSTRPSQIIKVGLDGEIAIIRG